MMVMKVRVYERESAHGRMLFYFLTSVYATATRANYIKLALMAKSPCHTSVFFQAFQLSSLYLSYNRWESIMIYSPFEFIHDSVMEDDRASKGSCPSFRFACLHSTPKFP